jgi:IS5 family transposase
MSKISRFTKKAVRLAKNAVGGRGEVAAPEGGGGFADYAVVSLHCLRVYLDKSYREALDLLSEMPQILGEIGLDAADLPHHSTLVKWFDRIKTALWRVLLCLSAQLHDPSGHAAIDATFFDRENASKHYYRRTNYRVQTLKATALVDTETQAILDVHCTTEKRHDTQLGWRGRPPQRGRPRQPRCGQRLRLDEVTRETPRRRRKTANQTSGVPAHRSRAQRADRWASIPSTSDV